MHLHKYPRLGTTCDFNASNNGTTFYRLRKPFKAIYIRRGFMEGNTDWRLELINNISHCSGILMRYVK